MSKKKIKRETPQIQIPHPENWESKLYDGFKYRQLLSSLLAEYKVPTGVWSVEVYVRFLQESKNIAASTLMDVTKTNPRKLFNANGSMSTAVSNILLKTVTAVHSAYITLWDYYADTCGEVSFTKWREDPVFLAICERENEQLEELGVLVGDVSEAINDALMTDRVIRYAQVCYRHWGRKLYTISDDLAWQLNNTELRKFPSDLFQLPYPALYLSIPVRLGFKVYNEADGWCEVAGVYLTEDVSPEGNRLIRVLVTSVDLGMHNGGTSVYFWNIHLRIGSPLEEDLEYSIETAYQQTRASGHESVGCATDRLATFEMMLPHLLSLFRFIVNVILYATHPSADKAVVFSDNPNFQALYKKADEAIGARRKQLFSELNAIKTSPRILLGGSIKVSRQERADVEAFYAKRGKQCVRTYVAQHWQHIWSGPMDGERKRTYQLIKSYWRGPEDAPITTKVHHLV